MVKEDLSLRYCNHLQVWREDYNCRIIMVSFKLIDLFHNINENQLRLMNVILDIIL